MIECIYLHVMMSICVAHLFFEIYGFNFNMTQDQYRLIEAPGQSIIGKL